VARQREYRRRDGAPAHVDFVCQSITETLRQVDGTPLPERSVDVVNTSGIVGHHLDAESVRPLVGELYRVLKPDGVAMLDAGPTLAAPDLQATMERAGFTRLGHYYSWFGDATGEMVFQRV
jgi:SAM-dependent methyltransferase